MQPPAYDLRIYFLLGIPSWRHHALLRAQLHAGAWDRVHKLTVRSQRKELLAMRVLGVK